MFRMLLTNKETFSVILLLLGEDIGNSKQNKEALTFETKILSCFCMKDSHNEKWKLS